MHDRVVLNGKRPPVAVSKADVYFAFGDGRLTYDCITCQAQCCRGHGYAINAGRELTTQITLRPAVRLFLTTTSGPSGDDRLVVSNCPPACFFLEENGLCGVQQQHGYRAKPETCRLFPFNRFRRIGRYLVVAPHATICPLKVVPAVGASDLSRHEALFEAMAADGVSWDVLDASVAGETPDTWISRERSILARSESHLDDGSYLAFAAAQLELTAHGDASPGRAGAPEVGQLPDLCALFEGLLGGGTASETADERRDLTRTLVACTPALRSYLLLSSPLDARRAPIDVQRVPHLLLSLEALAAVAVAAGMARVTHQTLFRLLDEYYPLLRMLADADRRVVWNRTSQIDLSLIGSPSEHQTFVRVAKALLPAEQRKRARTLGAVLAETMQDDGVGRLTRLNRLARRIAGRVVPLEQRVERRSRPRVRPALRRLALATLSEHALTSMAERRARNRGSARR